MDNSPADHWMSTKRTEGPIPAKAGIGLRLIHHDFVLTQNPSTPWFEVHSENYLFQGPALSDLLTLRRDYPFSLHGVGLSLGSAGPLDRAHLAALKQLADQVQPGLMSEHLSWSIESGAYLNDLLPLPYTEEALDLFCQHVDEAQTILGRRLLIENPSTYLQFTHSTLRESEFIAEMVRRTGCGLLLDINNLYIGHRNHGIDPQRYLREIPAAAIAEIHLAGHAVNQVGDREIRIDDHGSPVIDPVWQVYRDAIALFGPIPTLIEWDTNIPAFPVLETQAAIAQTYLDAAAYPRNDPS